jgi:hypothetical protein
MGAEEEGTSALIVHYSGLSVPILAEIKYLNENQTVKETQEVNFNQVAIGVTRLPFHTTTPQHPIATSVLNLNC